MSVFFKKKLRIEFRTLQVSFAGHQILFEQGMKLGVLQMTLS